MKTQGLKAGLVSVSLDAMRTMRWTAWLARTPLHLAVAGLSALIVCAACGPRTADPPAVGLPEDSLQNSAYLSNGSIGLRFDEFGTGAFSNSPLGQKQAMFLAESYDEQSKHEEIRAFPNPLTPELRSADGNCFERADDLRQELDMERGILRTSWRFGSTSIETRTMVHPRKAACYQVWEVAFGKQGSYVAQFRGKDYRDRRLQVKVGTETLFGKEPIEFKAKAGEKVELTFWFGSNTDLEADLKDHEKFWREFWTTRIEIGGPAEDQRALDSFLFYLRTSTPSDGTFSLGPYGLSSRTYNGHTFWDADVWLFPALALLDPVRAKSVPNYRIRTAYGAERNFKRRLSWFREPPAETDVLPIPAIQYPWESAVSGLEVSPTETKQQHHVTGSVLWGLNLASDLGLADAKVVQELGEKAANFYVARSVQTKSSQIGLPPIQAKDLTYRTILQVVSPDEHYFGDHDLYTNAVAEWIIKTFKNQGPRFPPFYLPTDGKSYLNYHGDRLKGYKQTSGLLAAFPLQNPDVEAGALQMLDRFADKVSKNGPAMSDSIHATIWARLGEPDKAYAAWKSSWEDFVKAPFFLFSEKRARPSTYFTTGAAGALNTVLYGFVGIRIDDKPRPNSKFEIQLKNGRWLSIKPNLPKEWRSVKIRGLTVLGQRYTVQVDSDSVEVIPASKKGLPQKERP